MRTLSIVRAVTRHSDEWRPYSDAPMGDDEGDGYSQDDLEADREEMIQRNCLSRASRMKVRANLDTDLDTPGLRSRRARSFLVGCFE